MIGPLAPPLIRIPRRRRLGPTNPAPPSLDTPLLADASAAATLPAHLEGLAETARDYAKASSSDNTCKSLCLGLAPLHGLARRHGLPALPPDSQVIGLYIAACASGGRRPQTRWRPASRSGRR